jgi:hypothetical protein
MAPGEFTEIVAPQNMTSKTTHNDAKKRRTVLTEKKRITKYLIERAVLLLSKKSCVAPHETCG